MGETGLSEEALPCLCDLMSGAGVQCSRLTPRSDPLRLLTTRAPMWLPPQKPLVRLGSELRGPLQTETEPISPHSSMTICPAP